MAAARGAMYNIYYELTFAAAIGLNSPATTHLKFALDNIEVRCWRGPEFIKQSILH